jgi:hypothetical protein
MPEFHYSQYQDAKISEKVITNLEEDKNPFSLEEYKPRIKAFNNMDLSKDKKATAAESDFTTSAATVNLVRLIGKYTRMVDILSSISNEIITGLSQLVDLHTYVTYYFFCGDIKFPEAYYMPGKKLKY